VAGTAANFVLHVSDLMDGRARSFRVSGVPPHGAPVAQP
jgi:hypothetical protein